MRAYYRGHCGLFQHAARGAPHACRNGRRLDRCRDAARRSSVIGHVSFGSSVVSASGRDGAKRILAIIICALLRPVQLRSAF